VPWQEVPSKSDPIDSIASAKIFPNFQPKRADLNLITRFVTTRGEKEASWAQLNSVLTACASVRETVQAKKLAKLLPSWQGLLSFCSGNFDLQFIRLTACPKCDETNSSFRILLSSSSFFQENMDA
jgi:hypothetical protein